jgi:hypothetical protein
MTETHPMPAIRSEERGPHWVAWVPDENGKPAGSVILVGQTQTEAETRARTWATMVSGTTTT